MIGSRFFRRRPVIAFVLIAEMAGIDQIVKIVCATGSTRTVMVYGKFRACRGFCNAAITAAVIVSLTYLFMLRMWHSRLKADPFSGERQILLFKLCRLFAQPGLLFGQLTIECGEFAPALLQGLQDDCCRAQVSPFTCFHFRQSGFADAAFLFGQRFTKRGATMKLPPGLILLFVHAVYSPKTN